jgi:hypothetical protein
MNKKLVVRMWCFRKALSQEKGGIDGKEEIRDRRTKESSGISCLSTKSERKGWSLSCVDFVGRREKNFLKKILETF